MFKNATPLKVLTFMRYSVAASYFLPRTSNATKSQVTVHQLIRFFILLNVLFFLLPIINSLCNYGDITKFSFSVCLMSSNTKVLIDLILCVVHQDRLQKLMEIMEACCKNATVHENLVYQKYVEKSSTFYGLSVLWAYMTAVVFIGAALISTDEPFPLNSQYTFRTDYEPVKTILFLHQSIMVFAIASHACVSVLCAVMLLFLTARFQILYTELSEVKSASELIKCMKKYYSLKGYSSEVIYALQYVALCTVGQCSFGLLFCGIIMIEPLPIAVKFQFFVAMANGLLQTFTWAHPADQLLDQSENAMHGIYESKWYEQPTSAQKLVHIMLAPQEPVAIKIPCIMPQLSLDYFCTFITNMFSFFSVLRVTMVDDGK